MGDQRGREACVAIPTTILVLILVLLTQRRCICITRSGEFYCGRDSCDRVAAFNARRSRLLVALQKVEGRKSGNLWTRSIVHRLNYAWNFTHGTTRRGYELRVETRLRRVWSACAAPSGRYWNANEKRLCGVGKGRIREWVGLKAGLPHVSNEDMVAG
jgi:hypothetical protein